MLRCRSIEVDLNNQGVVFINGTVTSRFCSEVKCLTIKVNSGELHIGIDGVLGQEVNATGIAKKENLTKKLEVVIAHGNLTNFGTLCAQNYLTLTCNNIMLCSDSKHDTAQRGFKSFISLQKDLGFLSDIIQRPKTSPSLNDSRILQAVKMLDSSNFVFVVNEEVDPAAKVNGRSITSEFNVKCREWKDDSDKDKSEKEVIRGGLVTCKWRHGVIRSSSISCIVKEDIHDCSQLQGKKIYFNVGGSVTVVKPWTWLCGNLSGLVRGDFLFFDNAILERFDQLYVLRNVRIFETSIVWIRTGGKLYTGEVFENKSLVVSDGDLALDLGQLKQGSEANMFSNGDLLLVFRDGVENSWFGCVLVLQHFFIQLEGKVCCDASCFAKECDVEFFKRDAQLLVNQIFVVEEGSLNLKTTDVSQVTNFIVLGKLHAEGINGITVSVCTRSGAVVDLKYSPKDRPRPKQNTIDVITRSLDISADSVMLCNDHQDKANNGIFGDSDIKNNVSAEDGISVNGNLKAFGALLNIQSKVFNNSGMVKLSPASTNRISEASLLSINSKEDTVNAGVIECDGSMHLKAENLFNERGILKSPNMNVAIHSNGAATLGGRIYVDKYFIVISQSQNALSFSALGGKDESKEGFVLPDQFEVRCVEGRLLIDSAIAKSESNIEPECIFRLCKCLKLRKECDLGQFLVEFHGNEDIVSEEMNKSVLSVEDSLQASCLWCAAANTPMKERLSIEGPNKMTIIYEIKVDESIEEIVFDTINPLKCSYASLDCDLAVIQRQIECVDITAKALHIPETLRCTQPPTREKPSTIIVENMISCTGSLECVGSVEVSVGESFEQKQAESGGIYIFQSLKIVTGQNGTVSLKGSTKGELDSLTLLEIEAQNIDISGSLTEVSTVKIVADKDLHLTRGSKINSCESVEMTGEWITTAGSIEEFSHLHIQPWAILNSGQIESLREACEVTLSSDLALVNSGICRGQVTALEAPFLLSLPGEEITDVNDVTKCELVGRDNIKLESITCLLGGSALKSNKRIENNTVLLFKFLAYVACIPDAKSVEAWSKAGEWLKNIQKEYEASKDSQSSKSLASLSRSSMQSAEISLRLGQMYNIVNNFVAEALKNGIESFDVQKLVFIITSEGDRLREDKRPKGEIIGNPTKGKKDARIDKETRNEGLEINEGKIWLFESKKTNQEDGIHESGSYCFGEGVTFTDSFYEAVFDEVFCDSGAQFAGDIAVASKEMFLSKREKRAIAMLLLADETCSVGDIASTSLDIKSSRGKVELVGKIESDQATIEAKSGIGLAYHDKREGRARADHKFKSITMKTSKINEVNSFLKGEGVYADLRISDQLGLVLSDQDVVLSSCNLNHGYGLNLKASSVSIDNSSLRFDKGASISSDKTLNVRDSSVTSQNSVLLKSDEGNVNFDSSSLKAGGGAALVSTKGSVSVAAGSVSGEKGAVVKAKKDVIIDAIETRHSTSSSDRGFFSSSEDATSYSTVAKSSISSSSGSVSVESEEGKIKATATEIKAATNITISAKEDVVIQDKVTVREEEHVRSNWFRTKRTRRRTEEQHCSSLNSGGSLTVLSRDSNVTTIGTNCSVSGDMMLKAAGSVLCEDRILSQSTEAQSSGLSLSLENGLSFEQKSEQMMQQRLSRCTMKVGGNLSVSATNFDVKNAMGVDVGNMLIDAEHVNFEGAELNNSCKELSVGFGINLPCTVNVTASNASSKQKQVVNQGITVRGRTHFTKAQNVNLTTCNLETGAITGKIENLRVISKQSEIEAFENTTSVGFAIGPRFPIPEKFGNSQSSEVGKSVEKASGIHCSGPIQEEDFKVGSLNLKGSSFTADADIGHFAKKIISEKVFSYRSQSSSGFSLGVNKTGMDVGLSSSQKSMAMEHQGTVASSSGIVSEEIKKYVNTDYGRHARITHMHKSAFGFNFKLAKDGVGAGVQVNDRGAGVFASKEKIGGHAQCGDKGFALSGGTSGVSGSFQNGENSIGLGLSKEHLEMNVKSKDSAIGTSLGKRGISGSVQHKNFAMGGSLSKNSKSIQMSAGDLKTGFSREENSETGEKTTSANVHAKDLTLAGSTSKNSKSLDFAAGDVKTGFKQEKNSKTGEKTTSANVQAKDFKLAGSTSKNSKSLDFAAGDVKTGFKQEKNSKTGEKTTSANVQVADLQFVGSTSRNFKSLDFVAGDVKLDLSKRKTGIQAKRPLLQALKSHTLTLLVQHGRVRSRSTLLLVM